MLKRFATIVLAATLILGAPPLAAAAASSAPAMADHRPMPPDMPGKNPPPCCVDGLGCVVPALLPLPETPLVAAPRRYAPALAPSIARDGVSIKPELSPPIPSV